MAFQRYNAKGIIIGKREKGEADEILEIITDNFGRIFALGKGVRKIKSKLRSGTNLFYLSNVEFIQGKIFKTLTGVEKIKKFSGIIKSPQRMYYALFVSRLLGDFLKYEEKDESVWDLTLQTFSALGKSEKPGVVYFYFLWNFLSVSGYSPNLSAQTMNFEVKKTIKFFLSHSLSESIKLKNIPERKLGAFSSRFVKRLLQNEK